MSAPIKLVAVSGSTSQPSRSAALLDALTAGLAAGQATEITQVSLAELAPLLPGVVSAKDAPPALAQAIAAIERADVLVVAAPVYRGSYPGLFKHLFDLIHHESLFNVPVLLAASGGSDRHALVIEHQLRPLFAFFQTLTLPLGVYATDADFADYRISNPALAERIELAVSRARPWLRARI